MGPARPLRAAVARALETFQSRESEAWHPGAAFLGRPSSPPSAPRPPRGDPGGPRAGTGPSRGPEARFLKGRSETCEGLGWPQRANVHKGHHRASSWRCWVTAGMGGRKTPGLLPCGSRPPAAAGRVQEGPGDRLQARVPSFSFMTPVSFHLCKTLLMYRTGLFL